MNDDEQRSAFEGSIWVAVAVIIFIFFSLRHAHGSEPTTVWLDEPDEARFLPWSVTLHWNRQPRISIDDSALYLKEHIDYAVWILNQRTGLDMYFVPRKGDIHISAAGLSEFVDKTGSFWVQGYATTYATASTGVIDSADVVLSSFWVNAESDKSRATVVHELIHALGVNYHVSNPQAVMFAASHERYSLTYDDIAALPYPMNCAPEVLASGEVYMPAVYGFDLRLDSNLQIVSDFISRSSCSGVDVDSTEQGITVLFPSVLGYEGSYKNVVLNYRSGGFSIRAGEQVQNTPTYRLFGAYR